MRIQMELDRGYLPDAYGKYAAPEDCYDWSCRRSFPFTVEDVPYGTRALAVFFIDWDSVPVCGFPWIHWCAYVNGDFEGDIEFPDDLSRNEHSRLVQGYNSAAKSEPERGVGYIGPCPPDRDHKYTLQVIASMTNHSSRPPSGPTNCSTPVEDMQSTKQAGFCPAGARGRESSLDFIEPNPSARK